MTTTDKTDKPVKLYHPAFADVIEEVPAADVDRWVDAGWRKTKPKSSE